MTETILKTFYVPKSTFLQYALTNESSDPRTIYGLKEGDKNIALKPMFYNGEVPSYSLRNKVYFKDKNEIFRYIPGKYASQVPRNGNGNFVVYDCGIEIGGTLKNGKIEKLTRFTKTEKAPIFYQHLPFLDSEQTRYFIEKFLKQAEDGSLKLQNLTKVIMKKVLESLPK